MKRFLSVLCVLAMLLSIVPVAAFAAAQDLQALIDSGADEPIVLEADASGITVTRDTYVDLNGHDINGVTVLSGTLYCLDSQTADYTVADGVYGKVTNATGAVKAAEGYLQVGESFHAVNLDIYAMTLRAADVGVYYKSRFAADEIVAAQVESFGVALSVVTAPNASNLDSYCGYSVFEGFEAGEGANSVGTSTLLKGIMKASNGDNKNAKNASMPVYGRAYIKTADGYFFGETVKRSLQEQVEAIDKIWNSLTDSQKNPVLGLLESYTSVMESWNIPNIMGIQVPGAEGEIEIDVPVNAENGTVTEAVTVEQAGVSVTVPAGTKLAAGAEKLTVTVTPKEVSDAGLTLEESEVLMPMDVHVDGLAADNAAPLTIYLGKVMPENLNMGNYAVYHVENGKANEMTLIGVNEEFTAHNQYKYTLDGELTLYMASFSEAAVVYSSTNAWNGDRTYDWYTENPNADTFYIHNADELAGFGAIVGGMANTKNDDELEADIAQDSFAGQKIVLLADINIGDLDSENGIVFYPIGYWNSEETYEKNTAAATEALSSGFYAFMGTFDGNGNTISDFYQNTWEMKGDHNWYDPIKEQYYRDGMGLFGKVYGGTVKNLTVSNFSSDGEIATTGVIAAYADCGATFENIAIFDCNPRVYNIGNGGIVGCVGWYTKDVTTTPVTFKNISVDQTNKISALWGTYDVSCGGIVGQYYATSGQDSAGNPKNAGMTFTNCHVAAVMDVHNDVCANYQYYWYRYSGMMIGTIRANKKDAAGYTVANPDGITFTDCTYTLGEWNEYWYCELVKNSLASYTHDHQFSRLTKIANVSEIQDEKGNWNVEGNFVIPAADNSSAECYHIFKNSEGNLYRHYHDKADESNPNPYENFDVNGDNVVDNKDLKEDRQCYFMPFNQVFNGLGYGVKPTYEFTGITEVKGGTVKAVEKFDALLEQNSYIAIDATKKISELFAPKTGVNVSEATIHVFVSPVGEDSTVEATYACVTNGYMENASITFKGEGAAKITITDYYFCDSTVLYVIIGEAQPVVKFAPVENVTVTSGNTVTLGELFTAVEGVTIDSANVSIDGNGFTYAPNTTDWTQSTVTFNSGVNKPTEVTLTITDNDLCVESTTTVTVEPVPVQKFKEILTEVDAEQSYTLRQLFSYVDNGIAVQDAAVSVTGDNVTYTQATAWENATVTFNKAGTVTLTITDNYYCTATEVTITVNTIDKFALVFENTDEYLYRVGNATDSPVALNLLFKAIDGDTVNSADVTFTTVAGNASAIYTKKTPWTSGTIQFSGTGVIKVTITADNANPLSLNLEVVNATNTTSAVGATSKNLVLLKDVVYSGSYLYYKDMTLYGNGFTIDITGADHSDLKDPSDTNSNKSAYCNIWMVDSSFDNVRITGSVYPTVGMNADDNYGNAAIRAEGTCYITNSYISNCRVPLRVQGDVTLIDTVVDGGRYANIEVRSGKLTLDGVTTINTVRKGSDGKTDVIGFGIVIHADAANTAISVINGGLKQYNWVGETKHKKVLSGDTYLSQAYNLIFSDSNSSSIYFDYNNDRYVNTGILCLCEGIGSDVVTGLDDRYNQEISAYDAWVLTYDNSKHSDWFNQSVAVETVAFNAKQYPVIPEYDGDDAQTVEFTKGETYYFDTSVLTAKKFGQQLVIKSVMLGGNTYNYGDKIPLTEGGAFEVVYTVVDPYNYNADASAATTVEHTKSVSVTAIAKDAEILDPKFTFIDQNGNKYESKTVKIGTKTYVMPNVSAADPTTNSMSSINIGSASISGTTVYFPVAKGYTVRNGSNFNRYYPLFNGINITDYTVAGDTTGTTYTSSADYKGLVGSDDNYKFIIPENSKQTNCGDYVKTNGQSGNAAGNSDSGWQGAGYSPSYDGTYLKSGNTSASRGNDANGYERIVWVEYCFNAGCGDPYYYRIGYHCNKESAQSCVTPDTLITLADGTQKEIQYVTHEDQLLVWDFVNGEYAAVPSSIILNHGLDTYRITELTFDDGTVIKTINGHGFFDAEAKQFVLMDETNAKDYIGHSFVKQNGETYTTTKLVAVDIYDEYTEAWGILTVEHYNCITEGMFSLVPAYAPNSPAYLMPFAIGENMKYDEAAMQADIEKYGLYTYEDFEEYITYEQFLAFNFPIWKVAVGKGYITFEMIEFMLDFYLG